MGFLSPSLTFLENRLNYFFSPSLIRLLIFSDLRHKEIKHSGIIPLTTDPVGLQECICQAVKLDKISNSPVNILLKILVREIPL